MCGGAVARVSCIEWVAEKRRRSGRVRLTAPFGGDDEEFLVLAKHLLLVVLVRDVGAPIVQPQPGHTRNQDAS